MSANTEPKAADRSEAEATGLFARTREFAAENPYTVAILVVATIAGAVFGAFVPIGELSVTRRMLGGALAGFYFGLFPLGFRLFE